MEESERQASDDTLIRQVGPIPAASTTSSTAHSVWLIDRSGTALPRQDSKKLNQHTRRKSFDRESLNENNGNSGISTRKPKIIGDEVIMVKETTNSLRRRSLTQEDIQQKLNHLIVESRQPITKKEDLLGHHEPTNMEPKIQEMDKSDNVLSWSTNISVDQSHVGLSADANNIANAEINTSLPLPPLEALIRPNDIPLTYEQHTFRETMFWKCYCKIEQLKNDITDSIQASSLTKNTINNSNSKRSYATSWLSLAGLFSICYNVIFNTRNNNKQTNMNHQPTWLQHLQLSLLQFKRRLEINRDYYNITQDDANKYWEFRMLHSYKPALIILIVDIVLYFIVVPIVYILYYSDSSSSDTSSLSKHWNHPNLSTFHPNNETNSFLLAIFTRSFMWIIFIFCYLFYFIIYSCFSINDIELYFYMNLFNTWQILNNLILFINFIILIQTIIHLLLTDTICIIPNTYHPFLLEFINIFNDYCQILVLSLLPVSRSFMTRLVCLIGVTTSLRMAICMKHDFQNDSLQYLPLGFVIFTTMACLMNAGPLGVVGMDRTLISLFRNMQEQQHAAIEKMKLVNMLCNDIKIPTQHILRTFHSLDTVLYKTQSINLQQTIEQVDIAISTLNEIIDDLLFLVRVEENRFIFQIMDRINVIDLIHDTMAHVCRVSQLSLSINCRNLIDIEFISDGSTNWTSLLTNKQCFKSVLYYSYWVLLSLISGDIVSSLLKAFVKQQLISLQENESLFSIFISSVCDDSLKGIDNSVINILHCKMVINPRFLPTNQRSTHDNAPETLSIPFISFFESCCLICTKLISSCPGNSNWSISCEHGIIDFSIPFSDDRKDNQSDLSNTMEEDGVELIATNLTISSIDVKATEASLLLPNDSIDPLIVAIESAKLESEDSSKEESKNNYSDNNSEFSDIPSTIVYKENKKLLKAFLIQNSFGYVTDKSFENIFIDIIRSFPGGRRIGVFHHDVHAAILKIYRIAIVQSIAACRNLKGLGFDGKIVIITERLTYFGEEERTMFDYGLPIPCEDYHLHKFALWILQCQRSSTGPPESQADGIHDQLQAGLSTRQESNSFRFGIGIVNRTRSKVHVEDIDPTLDGQNQEVANNELDEYVLPRRSSRSSPSLCVSSLLDKFQKAGVVITYTSKAAFVWLMTLLIFQGQTPIENYSLNNYYRWKFLNPSGSHLHITMIMDASAVSAITFIVVGYLVGSLQWKMLIVAISSIVLPWIARNIVVRTVGNKFDDESIKTNSRNSFWQCWFLVIIVEISIFVTTFFFDFWMPWSDSSSDWYIKGTNHLNITFDTFLNTMFGVMYGREILLTLVSHPYSIRILSEYIPWPWCFWISIAKTIRMCILLFRFIKIYLPTFLFNYILFCYIFSSAVIISGIYWREVIGRKGFESLYQTILAKDFRDRLVFMTNVAISDNVKQLYAFQHSLLHELTQACVNKEAIITESLLQHVHSLQFYGLSYKELLIHLQVNDLNFFSQSRQTMVSTMKATIISTLLNKICERFAIPTSSGMWSIPVSSGNTTTMIHFRVASPLILVRVDVEVFTAIIVQSLFIAMRHIEQHLNHSRKIDTNMNDAHEIVMWLHPLTGAGGVKKAPAFTDVRTMVLTILDTGLMSPPHELSDENFPVIFAELLTSLKQSSHVGSRLSSSGRSIGSFYAKYFDLPINYTCGQVLSKHGILNRYQSYQQIGIPYLLCADTHKIGQLFEVKEKEGVNTVDQDVVTVSTYSKGLYKQYTSGFGHVIDDVNNASNQRKFRHKLRIAMKSIGINSRSSFAKIVMFTMPLEGRGGDEVLKLRENRYKDFFKSYGWQQFSLIPLIDSLPNDLDYLGEVECVIIDASIQLTLSQESHCVDSAIGTSVFKFPLNSETSCIFCDALDLLHYIRGKGYDRLIVFAHSTVVGCSMDVITGENISHNLGNLLMSNMAHAESASNTDITFNKRLFFSRNPYSHGASADYHITSPFYADDAQLISLMCEKRRVELLLSTLEKEK